MANNENQSKNNTRRIYIRSQCRWQEVPEEVYQEHTRFHDTYRHRMQDRGLCCCPRNKWWVCDADCLTCEYRNADVIASLDSPIGEEDDDLILMDTIADDSVAVSELAADRIVLEQLFKRLADLMPEAADIGKLRMQGLSDEAIAKSIDIPRTTFLSRIKAAKKQLEKADENEGYSVFDNDGNVAYAPSATKDETETKTEAAFEPYRVRIRITNLNIRKGPGTNYGKTGQFTGAGVFTIIAESEGPGASKWGKLKSGAGWISLDHATKL